jgi:hypothetical protein
MQRFRIGIAALALTLACSTPAPSEAPVRQLTFLDSQQFDDELRAALKQSVPDVTVKFHGASVTVNHVPPRLDRWLYAISSRKGGSVKLLPDPERPATRGLGVMAALGLVTSAYAWVRDEIAYRPANDWNVIAYYDPAGEALTRVVFVPAADGAAQ